MYFTLIVFWLLFQFKWSNPSKISYIDAFDNEDLELSCLLSEDSNLVENFVISWNIPLTKEIIETRRSFFLTTHLLKSEIYTDEYEPIPTSGGSATGRNCYFPFITNEEKTDEQFYHFSCIDSGRTDHRCWCSADQQFSSDTQWGFCPCAKPHSGITLYAEYGTTPGIPCKFPFRYKGITYHECTTDQRGQCWCGTSFDVDKDDNWGYCACDGPPLMGNWESWSDWTACRCGEMQWRIRHCLSPKKLTQVPLGKKVLCPGEDLNVNMCKCDFYGDTPPRFAKPIIETRKRTTAVNGVVTNTTHVSKIFIKGLRVKDSGIFMCRKTTFKILEASKYKQYWNDKKYNPELSIGVNVQLRASITTVLLSNNQTYPKDYGKLDYRVIWKWTKWTMCSRCNEKGERWKYGFCHTRHETTEFEYVPCSLPTLSPLMKERVGHLATYMVVKNCSQSCIKPNILVSVFRSIFPTSPPPVKRKNKSALKGERKILSCLTKISNHSIAWHYEDINGEVSTPIMRHDSQLMWLIDEYHRLHIVTATEASAGYFSCYVDQKLEVSYRIFVIDETEQRAQVVLTNIGFFSFIIFFLVFFLVGLKVVTSPTPK